jgi:ArsR family transcriptional regulator
MDIADLYSCLSDASRLRMINLLLKQELCVCHIQEVLNLPQVRVSKHLAFMKERGLLQSRRYQNWMIYSLCFENEAVQRVVEPLPKIFTLDATYSKDLEKLKNVIKQKPCSEIL